MADHFIQLPDDFGNDGKKKHTERRTIAVSPTVDATGAIEVHEDYSIVQGMAGVMTAPLASGAPAPVSIDWDRRLRVVVGSPCDVLYIDPDVNAWNGTNDVYGGEDCASPWRDK